MNSPEYAAAYNEVKNYGGDGVNTPTLRTEEQTHIGIYWGYDGAAGLGTPPRLYNQIARTVANQQKNTQAENARLFALLNFARPTPASPRGGRSTSYDVWRPIRGIRQTGPERPAARRRQPAHRARPELDAARRAEHQRPGRPTNFTPPFPAYTSGHATFGAASFQTLARFYGRDDIKFTFMSDEYNGVNRRRRRHGPQGQAAHVHQLQPGRRGERPEPHLPRHPLGVRQDRRHRAGQRDRRSRVRELPGTGQEEPGQGRRQRGRASR